LKYYKHTPARLTKSYRLRFYLFYRRIQPAQNAIVSIVAMGEGWHNYHHVFPWDYRAAEIGGYLLNTTTLWLDMFSSIGWAYDLKAPSKQLVQQVAVNHGDGSWREVPETAHTRDYKTSWTLIYCNTSLRYNINVSIIIIIIIIII